MKLKRFVAICLLLCMVVNILSPLQTNAATVSASGTCGENVTWQLDDEGVLTISGTGEMEGYKAGTAPWYDYSEQIQKVAVEEGVTKVGSYAFYGLSNMTSFTLADSVTYLDLYAFANCTSLKTVTVPDTVETIYLGVFSGCSALERMTLPFAGAQALEYDEYTQFPFGYIFGRDNYEGSTSVMQYYKGTNQSFVLYTEYFIPSSLHTVVITGGNVHYGAFYSCTMLKSITLPETTTAIDSVALYDCSALEAITIPASVTAINSMAFAADGSLKEVYFVGDAPTIAEDSFKGCTLTAYYPAGNETWTEDVMQNYGGTITWVVNCEHNWLDATCTTPKTCTVCGAAEGEVLGHTWSGDTCTACSGIKGTCGNNAKWVLTDGILTISGTGAMENYVNHNDAPWYTSREQVEKIVIEAGITSIGRNAFYGCGNATSVTIPDSVTAFSYGVFFNCSGLTSFTIPDSVTNIGSAAFYNCDGLTTITVPANVTSIYSSAFASCDKLIAIVVDENNPNFCSDNGILYNKSKTKLVQVPGAFSGHFTVPDGVTEVGAYAFSVCKNLTSVTLPDTVTSIGEEAFQSCTNLSDVTFPAGLTSVGKYAFYGCDSLTSFRIPAAVTSIGHNALCCQSVTGIWVDENNSNYSSDSSGFLYNKDKTELVQSPGGFSGCYVLPNTVTEIDDFAVYYSYFSLVIYCGTEEQWNAIDIGSNASLTNAERQYHAWAEATCTAPKTCTLCGQTDGETLAHTYENHICSGCGLINEEALIVAMDLSGDGKVSVFDAQILAEANAGLRILSEEQLTAIGTMTPANILDYVLGRYTAPAETE